jgi:hypothetical protein
MLGTQTVMAIPNALANLIEQTGIDRSAGRGVSINWLALYITTDSVSNSLLKSGVARQWPSRLFSPATETLRHQALHA